MSGGDNTPDCLCQSLERHDFATETETGSQQHRDSDASDTSQASTLAHTRRRSRAAPALQGERSDRIKRKIYPKVRTGCDTCKQRKIKCDETKPECRNCTKSGRHCLGYHPPKPKLFEPQRLNHLDPASEDSLIEYFKSECAVSLASYRFLKLGLDFWQGIVPTLALDCQPIRHAMLAFASTRERYQATHCKSETPQVTANHPYFALEQYTEVLEKLNSGISAASISTNATLICCLLLTLCDLLHLVHPQSFRHVFGGLNLCKVIKKTSPAKSPLPEATEFNGTMMLPAFEYFADCAIVACGNASDEQMQLLREFEQTVDLAIPSTFIDFNEAYALVDKIFRQIAKHSLADSGGLDAGLYALGNYLPSILTTLQDSLSQTQEVKTAIHFRLLIAHQRMAGILVAACSSGSQLAYDKFLDDFDIILTELEDIMQLDSESEKPGLVSLTFLVATKCRNHTRRHRALCLLHDSKQAQHFWTSCTAHQVAKNIILLEETDRVDVTGIYFDRAKRQIELEYTLETDDSKRTSSYQFPWYSDDQEISAVHPVESCSMPGKLVRTGGYSALPLAFPIHRCHCDE